jgi:hypothetical protein
VDFGAVIADVIETTVLVASSERCDRGRRVSAVRTRNVPVRAVLTRRLVVRIAVTAAVDHAGSHSTPGSGSATGHDSGASDERGRPVGL